METTEPRLTSNQQAKLPNGKIIEVYGELFDEPFAKHEGVNLNSKLTFRTEGKIIETLVYEVNGDDSFAKCILDHVDNIEKLFPELCQ